MKLLARFSSQLGLTRGDVTVALFLTATAVAGLIYTTFFDGDRIHARRDLLALSIRHDSMRAARDEARQAAMLAIVESDSVPEWTPLTAADAARDSLIESSGRPSSSGRKTVPTGPVDINHAPKAALMRLPGVGEKTALAIIEMRKHVPFRRPEDIMNVKGIGEKKFQKMKPYIVVK